MNTYADSSITYLVNNFFLLDYLPEKILCLLM